STTSTPGIWKGHSLTLLTTMSIGTASLEFALRARMRRYSTRNSISVQKTFRRHVPVGSLVHVRLRSKRAMLAGDGWYVTSSPQAAAGFVGKCPHRVRGR